MTRPSKASPNSSPLAAQGISNQPYQQSAIVPDPNQGSNAIPYASSWDASAPNGHAPQAVSGQGSAPVAPTGNASPSRFSRISRLFGAKGRQQRALLDHPDPVLSSIAEADPETGVVDASLHGYHSTDLDAANAAASANKLWAISSSSLAYPVPSPSIGRQQAGKSDADPGTSAARALPMSRSGNSRPGRPVPALIGDWSTGISGMGTTRAASQASNVAARRKQI